MSRSTTGSPTASATVSAPDSNWAAVKHAALAWQVAVGALFLNLLLIITTLVAPAYQKSLETVDKQAEQKEFLATEVQGGFSALLIANSVLDSQSGLLSNFDCKSGIALSSVQTDYVTSLVERTMRQTNILLPRVRLTPLFAEHYRKILDLREDLLARIRLERMGDKEDGLDKIFRDQICDRDDARLISDKRALRSVNDRMIASYLAPVNRPFWIFDGPPPRPERLVVHISGRDVDYTVVNTLLNQNLSSLEDIVPTAKRSASGKKG